MVVVSTSGFQVQTESDCDWKREQKAFDDTKAGVRGLVNAGVTKIPRMFKHEGLYSTANHSTCTSDFQIPIIDLKGLFEDSNVSTEVIDGIRDASEKEGFFQVINHGIPVSVLDEMIDGITRFHEQDVEMKKEFYSRDYTKKVAYFSNLDLYKKDVAYWKDSFRCALAPDAPRPGELPDVCRDILIQYTNQATQLADKLSILLSQALGLSPRRLKDMGCTEQAGLLGHYYPASPEPELTIGTGKHTDPTFITMILQNHMEGLQVLHENQWVDVPPVRGGLVVNIGDLLQLLSNDKFKSVTHRVLSKRIGPRISVSCFFMPPTFTGNGKSQRIGPIMELLSQENPSVYRETNMKDFMETNTINQLEGIPPLLHLRL